MIKGPLNSLWVAFAIASFGVGLAIGEKMHSLGLWGTVWRIAFWPAVLAYHAMRATLP